MKSLLQTVFTSIITGQWIIDLVRHLVKTAGNIAESIFLIAVVYVTVNNVAHTLVVWMIPHQITTINQVAVISFSVLPELIAVNAILATYDHWTIYRLTDDRASLLWAIAYTVPTIMFLVMTVITLATFTSVEATSSVTPTATGAMLVTRCLAGWFYGIIQMLYSQRRRPSHASHLRKLKGDIDAIKSDLTKLENENQSLKKKLTRPKSDSPSKNGHLPKLVDII